MTCRRSFLKSLFGAVAAIALARKLGAELPLPPLEETPPPDIQWIVDWNPIRGVFKDGVFTEIEPYREDGMLNPEYYSAPHELRIGQTENCELVTQIISSNDEAL